MTTVRTSSRCGCTLLASALLFLLPVQQLRADTVDAKAELEAALQSKGTVNKQRTIRGSEPVKVCGSNDRGHEHCWIEHRPQTYIENYLDYLHVTSLDVAKVLNIEYGAPVLNSIPAKVDVKSFRIPNCTSVQQTTSTTLQMSITTSQTITFTRTVTTSTTLTAGIQFSHSFTYMGATAGNQENASVSVTKSVAIAEGTQSSETQNNTSTELVQRAIPKMTEVYGNMQVIEGSVSVPFTANIIVDGTVDDNLDGYKRISDLIDEAHRTFKAIGEIRATTASDQTTRFYEKALTSEDCKENPPAAQIIAEDGLAIPLVDLKKSKLAEARNSVAISNLGFLTLDIGNPTLLETDGEPNKKPKLPTEQQAKPAAEKKTPPPPQ
jgi:hypothetical protein